MRTLPCRCRPVLRVTMCEHAEFRRPLRTGRSQRSEISPKSASTTRFLSVAVEAVQADRGPGPGGRRDFERPQRRADGWRSAAARYDDARAEMPDLRMDCDDGDRRACIRFGIAIGRNWERRDRWRQESPELFKWERDR